MRDLLFQRDEFLSKKKKFFKNIYYNISKFNYNTGKDIEAE